MKYLNDFNIVSLICVCVAVPEAAAALATLENFADVYGIVKKLYRKFKRR